MIGRMMPPVQISYIYMGYFIPYILLFMFLLMPIPLAIVYEGYRENRMSILIGDRLKQRESLLACFICLD
jgi:two pore calcium channel protein 1/two pore calcium channel protein 3